MSLSPLLASVDRGPGLYFDLWKLLAVTLVYLSWLRTCWWVDRDARLVGLPAPLWNVVLLVCGGAGLVAFWVLPLFWASFPALVALYLAPTLIYVAKRNDLVPDELKVLTPAHLRKLARRYLSLQFGKTPAEEQKKGIPLRFIGKSADSRKEDNARVRRAQESAQYRLALELVHKAIVARATDIHLEPTEDEMIVRVRIDGILQPHDALPRSDGDPILNIFKVLADLDITEKRKPQDGSFSAILEGPAESGPRRKGPFKEEDAPEEEEGATVSRVLDFRVATAGSVVGEKMVMRILDRSRVINDLTRLGMRDRMREQIAATVRQPHGMFIVCGPTGAGKSTTLYACLAEIDRFQKNVITVENPVEYHIDNVTQIEINPKAGKTFASELRSILRQDPDVIYIGEVRDQETAEIACQASQTGHMVFTTLHANDTATAIIRLLDLGVQPFMVASSLSAVLGQRLVRVLCPKCKVGYKPNPDVLRRLHLPAERIKALYRPPRAEEVGEGEKCSNCGGTGYRGRTGIFELLVINDKVREMIKESPNIDAIRQEASKAGMLVLMQDGMRVVIEGETSVEELQRVAK